MNNIIITGTSRGIGFELVKLFSKAGYNVLALSRNTSKIEDENLSQVTSMPFDLLDSKAYSKVGTFILETWNGNVDYLVNNAGCLINKPFHETTIGDFDKVYRTNVYGVSEMIRTCIPYFTDKAHVVTISSMGGVQGSMKFPGLSAYSSSKGAVITLTELLAEEYKSQNIAFNVLAIGAVQTEMLEEAFPGYEAPLKPIEMAGYIYDFTINGKKFFNGKLIQVSSTTP